MRRKLRYRRTEWAPTPATVAELLRDLGPDVERVYLVGPRPGGTRPHAFAYGELPPEWSHDARGHYLDDAAHPVLAYTRTVLGRVQRVEVLRAAAWYGPAGVTEEADYTPEQADTAHAILRAMVRDAFDGAELLNTPAQTGRECWARTIIREREFPVLSDAAQDLIRRTASQGRITHDDELAARADERPELPGLALYDGRLMYAALCRQLPVGEPVHDQVDAYAGYQAARYLVAFTVPTDWRERCECGAPGHAGIGLLGVRASERDETRFPSEPGASGTTWCDGAELHVALRHGWAVQILERLVWEPYTHAGPLDNWARKLAELRESVALHTADPIVRELVRRGLRAMVLFAIGAFTGRDRLRTHSAPIGTLIPAEAQDVRVEGEHVVWAEPERGEWSRRWAHPEWSAAVWCRARARLLAGPQSTGALYVPARDVVAFRTDAVYLAATTDWPDDGKPGRLRLTARVRGPLAHPRNTAELFRAIGK